MSNRHCNECSCIDTSDNPICEIVDDIGTVELVCMMCLAERIHDD